MKLEDLQRAFAPIWNAIRSSMSRGVIKLSNDSKRLQEVQVSLGNRDLRSNVERWQNYGFTSRPLDGAEALYLAPGGERSLGAVIAVEDRRYRLQGLEKGEVAIHTDEGTVIKLKRGGGVEIGCTSLTVTATGNVDIAAIGELKLEATSQITLKAPSIDFEQ